MSTGCADDSSQPGAQAYYCDTRSIADAQYDAMFRMLSPDEQARAEALVNADDRRDYVVAHALLRRALAVTIGEAAEQLVFETDSHGKPFLPPRGGGRMPFFSLSHSLNLVACAVSPAHTVGIDVDVVNRAIDAQRIANLFFTADEAATLRQCTAAERSSRFCELWTLKEAWLKATGLGLAAPLDSVAFRVERGRVRLTSTPPGVGTDWTFALMDVGPSHKLAAAVGTASSRTQVIQVSPAAILHGALAAEGGD